VSRALKSQKLWLSLTYLGLLLLMARTYAVAVHFSPPDPGKGY
jgi:hypothetical protein